jgi:ABC-type transport system involved in cytochrome c biogenesis permease subunit
MASAFNVALLLYFVSLIVHAVHLISRRDGVEKAGRVFIFAGLIANMISIILRWQAAGRPPFTNMYESMVFFAWSIAAVYLMFSFSYRVKQIGFFVSLLLLFTMGIASLLNPDIEPLVPALQSNWLTIHVVTCFLGYAGFAISFVASIYYLAATRSGSAGIERIDELSYRSVGFGFLFLTLGIITGSVWANTAWGSYWSWDPKETWSLITWLVYAIFLHQRLRGWKGKRSAWISIIGFTAVIFTYFGVNYLLSGLHSYA